MYIIAVTGGIACGKTVVSREIQKFGAVIISADRIAHALSRPGRAIYNAYVEHFGRGILDAEEKLDRRAIAGIVFNDPEQRKWINQTTHPLLLNRVRDKLVKFQERGVPIAVLDVPLLFEAGWEYLADEVWVVCLNRGKQFRRLMFRNQLTPSEAEARINSQMSIKDKRERADRVINNNRTRATLKRRVQEVMNRQFPHLTRTPPLEEELEAIKLSRTKRYEEWLKFEAERARARAQTLWDIAHWYEEDEDDLSGSPVEM